MKKLILLLSISLFWNCQKGGRLKIEDLKFSNLDQQAVLKNSIKKTYLISGFESGRYKEQDTIGILKYNQNGGLMEKKMKGLFGSQTLYKYDSLNLVSSKEYSTDFVAEFKFNYEFNSDSLILYKKYKDPKHENLNGEKPIVSGKFKFNKLGFLIESSDYQNNDLGAGAKFVTKYGYDSLNQLRSKRVFVDLSKVIDTTATWHSFYRSVTAFYYTNKKIDSSITIYDTGVREKRKRYDNKTVYDKNGLIEKTILSDSIVTLYKHER
ncbi:MULTISPECIES: hypothetical protein [unclassified Tenacibaculum]|uniref:hypothetical protein n=1 Tax=unclassified Tenacibaculum TaxID=2635139 RepID=UPI001F40FFE8|nr:MULTISPECIES: hypothetical protein [unclassified Tenacibaculum]MCF2875499.1 hypothetical protein [Tenacibaculum sp. Cn5-1]MCF2935575.1 hypothetical protein [Tenacibaculum sp. Cn5-34]MCG7512135.1 hypothetical protein [Tenacibaculum sp. Cn5-46]